MSPWGHRRASAREARGARAKRDAKIKDLVENIAGSWDWNNAVVALLWSTRLCRGGRGWGGFGAEIFWIEFS